MGVSSRGRGWCLIAVAPGRPLRGPMSSAGQAALQQRRKLEDDARRRRQAQEAEQGRARGGSTVSNPGPDAAGPPPRMKRQHTVSLMGKKEKSSKSARKLRGSKEDAKVTPIAEGTSSPDSYKTPTGAVTSTIDTVEYAKRKKGYFADPLGKDRTPLQRFLIWWVIDPRHSRILSIWDIVCVVALFFVALVTPFGTLPCLCTALAAARARSRCPRRSLSHSCSSCFRLFAHRPQRWRFSGRPGLGQT